MSKPFKIETKICGLRDAISIETAIAGGASHIGFIFFPKSPRNISPIDAGNLSLPFANRVKRVAVTVNADNQYLDDIVEELKPDILQLHGSETPQRALEIKRRYNLPIMKALSIHGESDFSAASAWDDIAERMLFDAKPPKGSDLPGGNGVSFDWRLFCQWQETREAAALKHLDSPLNSMAPPMLSGGINQNNIVEAITLSKARAIDLSSGVESSPGVKDPAAISALLDTIGSLH